MEIKIKDSDLNGKKLLITGGSGSFGNCILDRLHKNYNLKEIIIFSRDEKKQHDMRIKYKKSRNVKFIIGDVRDYESVYNAMIGVDYVFHAAALKQVPSCELFPIEAVKTNIIGSNNVLNAAERCNVKKVVVLSTDKSVYPINAMGISKAMMEKLLVAKSRMKKSNTIFCGVRYGNVMYSRGSVIPLFIEQIKNGEDITITNGDMTRFLLPLPIAIDLVLFAFDYGDNGDILIRKSPASTVNILANAIKEILKSNTKIKYIGLREGEKMHETLLTKEEIIRSKEYKNYYKVNNIINDYGEFYTKGKENTSPEGYTSENTTRLNKKTTKELLLTLDEIKKIL